jgi:hypothetical protein
MTITRTGYRGARRPADLRERLKTAERPNLAGKIKVRIGDLISVVAEVIADD